MRFKHYFLISYYLFFLYSLKKFNDSINSIIEKNEDLEKNLGSWKPEIVNQIFALSHLKRFKNVYQEMPTVYIITPTHQRLNQLADLNRIKNTLLLVPKLVWIIVEDSFNKTQKIIKFVKHSHLNIIHLSVKSLPAEKVPGKISHKGVEQRNEGLKWIKENKITNGIFYLADDDNSYDIRLFEEIRSVKNIGVWPVGMVGGIKYERPLCKYGKVVDWFFTYNSNRYFPLDMGSFGIHTKLLNENTYFERHSKADLEGDFLKKFSFKVYDLEPKANNCLRIYVWHTKTKTRAYKNGALVEEKFLDQI